MATRSTMGFPLALGRFPHRLLTSSPYFIALRSGLRGGENFYDNHQSALEDVTKALDQYAEFHDVIYLEALRSAIHQAQVQARLFGIWRRFFGLTLHPGITADDIRAVRMTLPSTFAKRDQKRFHDASRWLATLVVPGEKNSAWRNLFAGEIVQWTIPMNLESVVKLFIHYIDVAWSTDIRDNSWRKDFIATFNYVIEDVFRFTDALNLRMGWWLPHRSQETVTILATDDKKGLTEAFVYNAAIRSLEGGVREEWTASALGQIALASEGKQHIQRWKAYAFIQQKFTPSA